VGWGFARGRASDRFVTVKGISEREVKADLALWPLRIVAADDDLARGHQQVAASVEKVRAFLSRHGIDGAQAALQSFRVTDAYANQYRPAGQVAKRYVIEQSLIVRSGSPPTILAASQQVGELVRAGVVLSSQADFGPTGPTFLFTRLNELKPKMIAEATARAREAAEQFARDSHSALAGIRRANQGVFEILPRDQAEGVQQESQVEKRVRVVATVEYFLKD
jgi:uncharacterized protein